MALQRTKLVRQDDEDPRITRIHDIVGSGPVRIGADLRGERLRKGLSLEDTAKRLRIGVEFLQAMEDGRFEALPGRTYAVGFLRGYANFLGLDADRFVERFRDEAGAPQGPTELNFPEPLAPPSLPTGRLVGIALALAVIVFGGWSIVQDRAAPVLDRVAEVPADLKATTEPAAVPEPTAPVAASAPTAVESAVPARAAAPAEPAVTVEPEPPLVTATAEQPPAQPVAVEPLPSEPVMAEPVTAASTAAEPATIEETLPVEPPPAQPGAVEAATVEPAPTAVAVVEPVAVEPGYVPIVYGGETAGRVVITATHESWVQVRDPDGTTLFTRILKPGDVYHVPDRAGLKLHTGNAGGIVISVDGGAVPPLGGLNEVKRRIVLEPDRLLAGTAVP